MTTTEDTGQSKSGRGVIKDVIADLVRLRKNDGLTVRGMGDKTRVRTITFLPRVDDELQRRQVLDRPGAAYEVLRCAILHEVPDEEHRHILLATLNVTRRFAKSLTERRLDLMVELSISSKNTYNEREADAYFELAQVLVAQVGSPCRQHGPVRLSLVLQEARKYRDASEDSLTVPIQIPLDKLVEAVLQRVSVAPLPVTYARNDMMLALRAYLPNSARPEILALSTIEAIIAQVYEIQSRHGTASTKLLDLATTCRLLLIEWRLWNPDDDEFYPRNLMRYRSALYDCPQEQDFLTPTFLESERWDQPGRGPRLVLVPNRDFYAAKAMTIRLVAELIARTEEADAWDSEVFRASSKRKKRSRVAPRPLPLTPRHPLTPRREL